MEVNKTRYDSTLAAAAGLGIDTLKKNLDEGRKKLGLAAKQLAETGSFAKVTEFTGDGASIKESMSNLNTDLAAWGKEHSDRQSNVEWAKKLEDRENTPVKRPTPEQLNSGIQISKANAPFLKSVNSAFERIAKVMESGMSGEQALKAINGIVFNAEMQLDESGIGESILNAAFGTASWTPESTRTGLVPTLPRHVPILPAILPVVTWSQAAYPYVQEKTAKVGTGGSGALESRGNADRDEGAKGPEATLEMELVSEPITSKAFTLPVHQEVLEDVPGSRSHVTGRMPMLMQDVLNNNLLNGNRQSNATNGIVGFLNRAGTRSMTFDAGHLSDPTQTESIENFVKIHEAIVNQVGNAAAYPDQMILNLQLYHQFKTARDADGRLLLGDYTGRGMDVLFGVPFGFHPNMPVNANGAKVGIMGAFRSHCAYISRKGMTLAYSDSNADEFEKLIGRWRIDVRHGLAVYRPAAFTVLTADATTF